MKANVFNKKVIIPLMLLFIVLSVMGCNESNSSTGVIPWADDGVEPNNPTWKIDTPYVVQKAGQNFYQVTLDWNPVTTNKFDEPKKNIVGYYIYRRREGGADKKVATATDDHYVDKDVELVEGERYIYSIVCFDNLLRQSPASAPQLIRLEPTTSQIPKPPSNLFYAAANQSTLSSGKGSIVVSWDPPTQNTNGATLDDLMEFEIQRHEGAVNAWQTIAKIPAGKNLYIDANLNLGTYYYRVRALDKDWNPSQWVDGSFTLTGRMDDISPGMIFNLVADGDAKVSLTWSLPMSDVDFNSLDIYGVKVYRKRLDVDEAYTLVKVLAPDTSWSDVTVDLDTYYQYSLTAFDISGNESSKSKPATNRVGVTFPDTPGGLTATLFVGQVWLSWAAVSGASTYVVYRSEYRDGIYTTVGETSGNTFTDAISSVKNYYYKIAAKDANGRTGSPTHHVVAIGDLISRVFEAEGHISTIARGTNAINAPFQMEVDVLAYPFENNAYLLFDPIDETSGEQVDGNPLPNLDSDAVATGVGDGDWYQFNEWIPAPAGLFTSAAYNAEIWSLRTGDAGIYQVLINDQIVMSGWDNYSTKLQLLSTPITFSLGSITGNGQVTFKFVCVAKNPSSIDYRLYLDKIVIR